MLELGEINKKLFDWKYFWPAQYLCKHTTVNTVTVGVVWSNKKYFLVSNLNICLLHIISSLWRLRN